MDVIYSHARKQDVIATAVMQAQDGQDKYPPGKGTIVPDDSPNSAGAQDQGCGPNNEKLNDLKPELVACLKSLIETARTEALVARRHEIRTIRQARFFWQEIQYIWWDVNRGDFQFPQQGSGAGVGWGPGNDESPRFQYTTNIYQGYGLSFIAVFSQDVPSVTWYPQNVNRVEDVTAAKAASDAADLIEENNKVAELLTKVGYYLWTDGKIGSYTRYVVDGDKFGYQDEDDMEQSYVKMGEDSLVCPQCQNENPIPPSIGLTPPTCENCGEILGPDNLKPAEMMAVPQATVSRKVPNGQEVITIVGGLELNTPVWADEQCEFPYLQWQQEVHRAKLKATYPHVADKIAVAPQGGAEDVYARASRVSVAQGLPYTHPGDTLQDLATFLRTWIRPWLFYMVEDTKNRNALLKMFPSGCYVAFAGDTYCESRDENMDDHWRVMHALPGNGQNRPAVGKSLINIQEQFNNYANIMAENIEMGIPPLYADPQTIEFDAYSTTVAEPAAIYPARAKAGMSLADSFYQPAPGQIPADMSKYMQWLMGDVAQFLTGMFPAVFGGEMQGNKTASGYAMARDQALGRLGLIWRRLKNFYAETLMLGVECFRKNRPGDVSVPILGEDNEFQAKAIRLEDLRGNIQARPEADETFPRLKSQQRAVLQQLMALDDPFIQQALTDPSNIGYLKGVFGLTELNVPGEDSRNKQMRAIDQMLKDIPVQVNELLDNHQVAMAETKRWYNSDAGQEAMLENPQGVAMVEQNYQMHLQAAMAEQMALNPPPLPPMKDKNSPQPPSSGNEPPEEPEQPAPTL